MNAEDVKVGDVVIFGRGRYPVRSVVTHVGSLVRGWGADAVTVPNVSVRSLQSKRTGFIHANQALDGAWWFPSMTKVSATELERRRIKEILR